MQSSILYYLKHLRLMETRWIDNISFVIYLSKTLVIVNGHFQLSLSIFVIIFIIGISAIGVKFPYCEINQDQRIFNKNSYKPVPSNSLINDKEKLN